MQEGDENSGVGLGVDRLSALPDGVIRVILSLVPTIDAVRMSLLSKRWRLMWRSVPTLQLYFIGVNEHRFGSVDAANMFMVNCLKHRRRALRLPDSSAVASIKIKTYSSPWFFAALDKWIGSNVLMNNLKELRLEFLLKPFSTAIYTLPSAVMNGTSLTRLKLKGKSLNIQASCPVNLRSLKFLTLVKTELDSDTLSNLFTGCPALEECVIRSVDAHLRVSSLSLRILQVVGEVGSGNIQADNLQSLKLIKVSCFGFDFSACKAIRDLVISDSIDFEDQISRLPLLEKLDLSLKYFKRVNISSQSLKHFSVDVDVDHLGSKFEVKLDTPNLVSLSYRGPMNVRMSTGLFNHHVKAKFCVLGSSSELINFFSHINPAWNSLELSLHSDGRHDCYDIPKKLRKINTPPWHNLKHLKVKFKSKRIRKADFKKLFQRLAPSLETLTIN